MQLSLLIREFVKGLYYDAIVTFSFGTGFTLDFV